MNVIPERIIFVSRGITVLLERYTAGLETWGPTGKRAVFLVEGPAVRIPETAYHETVLYYDGGSCRFSGLRSKTRMALLEKKTRMLKITLF